MGLARLLQPSIVVCEDVDLVAQERGPMPGYSNPALFEMLNAIDGIEEDADITFVLTTNRADLLEPALAARPGRIDLAVEIPLPDPSARRRLLELYGRPVGLALQDEGAVVDATEGVTASFIRELVRQAALSASSAGNGDIVDDAALSGALEELLDESNALTRILLGRSEVGPTHGVRPGTEWLRPQGFGFPAD